MTVKELNSSITRRFPIVDQKMNNAKQLKMLEEDLTVFNILDRIVFECSLCGKDIRRDDVQVDNCPECVIRSVIET